jgi:hypothetical protein
MKTPTDIQGIASQMDQSQPAANPVEPAQRPKNPRLRRLIVRFAEIMINLGRKLKAPTLPF